ncbi:MAG: MFS transporter [Clostridia bacterium]|nr:MFS transporter [Clostridia bacterium]
MNLLSDINVHIENKRASRLFFIFMWLMYALVYMTKNCFSGALAAIVDEGTLTLTQATVINAAFYVAYAPLQILGGIFADKYSPEKLITVGLIGSAVSNVVIFFNQNFYMMLVSWVFSAIIQFALWPAVFKVISSQLVRSDRSKMVFYMTFSASGGLILAYAVSAFVPNWRYNFAISAIALVVLAIALLILCKALNPLLKKDQEPVRHEDVDHNIDHGQRTAPIRIFLISGFFVVLPAIVLRMMVENGSKTLSPTMLSQSYENITPMLGNLLNILIISSGIVGMILIKVFVFPRLIKNELVCYLILLIISLPFATVLRFVGSLPIWLAVLSLCIVSMLLSATNLLTQYYNMHFVQYGLNGTAAGILNAAASFGLVLQYCVFGTVADHFGWQVVTTLWIVMIAVSAVCIAFGILPLKRFSEKE